VSAQVRDERLIVEDQGIWAPLSVPVRLVTGKAALELRRAVDLSRWWTAAPSARAR
jgi:hypothetical protein